MVSGTASCHSHLTGDRQVTLLCAQHLRGPQGEGQGSFVEADPSPATCHGLHAALNSVPTVPLVLVTAVLATAPATLLCLPEPPAALGSYPCSEGVNCMSTEKQKGQDMGTCSVQAMEDGLKHDRVCALDSDMIGHVNWTHEMRVQPY